MPGKAGLNSRGVHDHSGMDPVLCQVHSSPVACPREPLRLPAEERDSSFFREAKIVIVELLPVNEVAPCRDSYTLARRAEYAHALQLFLQVAVLDFDAGGDGHAFKECICCMSRTPQISVQQYHAGSPLSGRNGSHQTGGRSAHYQYIAIHEIRLGGR
jgi:hypothetical protein